MLGRKWCSLCWRDLDSHCKRCRLQLPIKKRTVHLSSIDRSSFDQKLPSQARVVVCGAGLVSNSVVYHLVKKGWKDIVVIEQGKIGCGTSWRDSGIVGHFNHNPFLKLIRQSSKLYQELQDQGFNVGWHQCGAVNLARTKERMVALQRVAAAFRVEGLECELLTPQNITSIHPLVNINGLEGGVWVPIDGVADPLAICTALATIAQTEGAKYFEDTHIRKICTTNATVSSVETNKGTIKCEYFISCAGMWSRELSSLCEPKFKIPMQAVEHTYLVTHPIAGLPRNLPVIRDYDENIYAREYNGGFLVGGFPKSPKALFQGGIPPKFEFQTLPQNWDTFKPLYEVAKKRINGLADASIQQLVNGPGTFTPDGQWIFGETPEINKFFCWHWCEWK